jgi:hypothetical protein
MQYRRIALHSRRNFMGRRARYPFLQEGEAYREFILPNGLPTNRDPQKRLVVTRKTLPAKDLESYLKRPSTEAAIQPNP